MKKIEPKWWVLIALSISLAMLFLDQTAVSVALPSMQRDLNANNTELQWIVNAYLLTTACFLLFGGKLGDIIGQRKLFLIGMAIFVIASATTALAHNEMDAIISRGIQGIGSACMIPPTNVIIYAVFKDGERGRAMGLRVAMASICLTIGPMIGGFFTEFMSWRWIFWINLPVGIMCASIAYFKVPRVHHKPENAKIDWPGFIVSLAALFCIVFSLMQTAEWGWGNIKNLSLLGLGIFLVLIFIKIERKNTNPFIDLSLFKNKGLVIGSLILLLVQTNFISRIFCAIFFQTVLGYSAFVAGLLTLPSTIPILFSGPLGGYLRDKYGHRLPLSIGTLLVAASALWVAATAWLFNFWYMLPGLIVFSIGAPMTIPTATAAVLDNVDNKHRGAASGISNAARNIGGTLGLAVMSSIIFNLDKLHLNQFLAKSGAPFHHLQAGDLSGVLAKTPETTSWVSHLTTNQFNTLHTAAQHAYTFGFSAAMMVVGIVGFVGFYLAQKLPKKTL